jgi:hypothetical protein
MQERQAHGLACISPRSAKWQPAKGPGYLLPAMSVLEYGKTIEKGNSLSNAHVREQT